MMTLHQKTMSAAKWSGLDVFMRQGVQFVVSIVLARILAPEDFGVIAMLVRVSHAGRDKQMRFYL